MRQLDSTPTHTPAGRHHEARHDHDQPSPSAIRLWAMLQALGYAGALIDPTGVLTARRFRRAEEEQRRGR
jgi:hypothetical protein